MNGYRNAFAALCVFQGMRLLALLHGTAQPSKAEEAVMAEEPVTAIDIVLELDAGG